MSFPSGEAASGSFLKSFSNWDGAHYLAIAKEGYNFYLRLAFFPLYPLVVRSVDFVIQSIVISGVIVSAASAFLGITFLYKLINLEFNEKIAKKTIIILLIFPTSYLFLTTYSEGLFFLLTILTFYFFKKKSLLLATIFASLSCLTRASGIAVALALATATFLPGFKKKNLIVLFSFSGIIIYWTFLFIKTQDPFYFFNLQAFWARHLSFPWDTFWEELKVLSTPGVIAKYFTVFIDFLFTIFGLGLALRTIRFLPPIYSIYSLIAIIIPITTSTFVSMPRFLLPIFPIFIALALTKSRLIYLYYFVSAILLIFFAGRFINGYWVS